MLLTPPMWACSSGSIASTSMVVALRGIPAVSSPSKHGLRRKRVRRRRPRQEMVTLVGIPALGPTQGHQECGAAWFDSMDYADAQPSALGLGGPPTLLIVAQAELTAEEPENHPVGATARRMHRERMRHKSGLARHEAQGRHGRLGCLPPST